jgi:hypothetical protein
VKDSPSRPLLPNPASSSFKFLAKVTGATTRDRTLGFGLSAPVGNDMEELEVS